MTSCASNVACAVASASGDASVRGATTTGASGIVFSALTLDRRRVRERSRSATDKVRGGTGFGEAASTATVPPSVRPNTSESRAELTIERQCRAQLHGHTSIIPGPPPGIPPPASARTSLASTPWRPCAARNAKMWYGAHSASTVVSPRTMTPAREREDTRAFKALAEAAEEAVRGTGPRWVWIGIESECESGHGSRGQHRISVDDPST